MNFTRRQMLAASGAALLAPSALRTARAADEPKKVLFFTRSGTFQHGPITRKDGKLGLAERIFTEIAKEHGYEVTCSKDGTLFNPDKIGQWDAFAFYTTGDLTKPSVYGTEPPMTPEGKTAFLDAIKAGKGFMGMHSATDTFHGQGDKIDPYIEMIGGEFIVHGDQQEVKLDVTDPAFPGAGGFGLTFEIKDEWYSLKNQADDLHVIIAHDTATFKEHTKGSNKTYDRPNFPETWAKMYGKGKVFYTSMGHREDVWENKNYQKLLIGALLWTTGMEKADIKPNTEIVTPYFHKLQNG